MTSSHTATTGLAPLARPSGGFAMLALDQRAALRAMLAEHQGTPVTDEQLTAFKVASAQRLTPYASAVLLDGPAALDSVLAADALASGCWLIAAVDRFHSDEHEAVAEVEIDEELDPAELAGRGVTALKLLVTWRPDQPAAPRIAMVEDFLARCRAAGLASVLEPVSRMPRDGSPWNLARWNEGVFAAAAELGSRGADLYKAEIPLHGVDTDARVRTECVRLGALIDGPWVVLSSGVAHDQFPRAVRLACQAGAVGFLAGRAVWRPVLAHAHHDEGLVAALDATAAPRLRELAEIVDATVAG